VASTYDFGRPYIVGEDQLYSVGDLVRLHDELWYNTDPYTPFRKARNGSAYYAIGMRQWMIGIIVRRREQHELADPDLWMPYMFIYDIFWSGGIGMRREQHEDLYVISSISPVSSISKV
jgi:hypothetical protein